MCGKLTANFRHADHRRSVLGGQGQPSDSHPPHLLPNAEIPTQTQKLVAYSVGRDEVLRFWDGFLSQNWIGESARLFCLSVHLNGAESVIFSDSEMLTRETAFCTFRPLKIIICTWNVDATKPDALVGMSNATFLQKLLANPALEGSRPDIVVFGFQEVIDLADKKLTASKC